jgi:hypothetical protein
MDLYAVARYCMDMNLPSTANWATDLIDGPDTINRYYIDTKIVKAMFSVGDSDRLFRELECEVATFIEMKEWSDCDYLTTL